MAKATAFVAPVGFFARHWAGMLLVAVAANCAVVGAILFEPGPARAQPAAAVATQTEQSPAPVGDPGARSPVEPTAGELDSPPKPVELRLPGYLPPLKGMVKAEPLAIGPDGLPMSPQIAAGFAMVDDFGRTLDRLLGDFERAGGTTAAAEAFNRAFSADAIRMQGLAEKLDVSKLPDADQQRLRKYAEAQLMPLIERMQKRLGVAASAPGQQDVEGEPNTEDAELREPDEMLEQDQLAVPEEAEPDHASHPVELEMDRDDEPAMRQPTKNP